MSGTMMDGWFLGWGSLGEQCALYHGHDKRAWGVGCWRSCKIQGSPLLRHQLGRNRSTHGDHDIRPLLVDVVLTSCHLQLGRRRFDDRAFHLQGYALDR